jgi:hypothetical protein
MHVSEKRLQSYLSGELSESISNEVTSHLDVCDRCRVRVVKSVEPANETGRTAPDERRRQPRMPTDDPASVQIISPLTLERMDVRIVDVSRNGLKIRSPRLLNTGAILQIQLRNLFIIGEVRYCVQTPDGFYAGLYIQDCVERRRAERVAVDIPATIAELQNDQPARIVDQSEEGMLIVADNAVPKGAAVRIIAEGKLILASVAHCNRDGKMFKIGIKIDQMLTL